jgi:hypothetical protein
MSDRIVVLDSVEGDGVPLEDDIAGQQAAGLELFDDGPGVPAATRRPEGGGNTKPQVLQHEWDSFVGCTKKTSIRGAW